MPYLCTILCRQIASTKWFLRKENELYSRDSRRLVPHRRLYLRVLGNRSSSSTRHLWECVFSHLAAGAESGKRAERRSRQLDKWPRVIPLQETGTERWVNCWEKAWMWSRRQNWRTCTKCNLERWRANGQNPRSSGKTQKWLTHEIHSGRSGKPRKLHEIQRGIQSRHPWNGQHRVVRN